jgi:hypothetical protein
MLACSIHSCITGRVRISKGAEYITPETAPLEYWGWVIGLGLVGLAFMVPGLISFLRAMRREKSSPWPAGIHTIPERQTSGEQPGGSAGMLFDPAEKIYEAPDDSVVQVCKDYVLYGAEGKAGAKEEDKIFFKDLARIKVIRSKKSGKVTSIDLKTKDTFETFEVGGYKQREMEEIAGLLETRIKGLPIQFVEKQSDLHLENYLAYAIISACAIVLLIIGIATYRVLFGR